ncbi:uncharacterized protein LOC103705897 isoform X2 [Phoenix dactylifera]|uniref:Uncharacterized protein LOC103705897 isoform X2 n=1 Tax=Phoenix dactylifera TaxID=42345 RepID=A0A8B7BYI5_PHODC|nr:uncharacterized protein LOC103705897 isoform X2 [Phoenix dactylifera]XP_008788013.1 uncharacterized protein LOC103705897 isoform X2 [Phoenix dactylifera]XP_026659994.1 uncharacterized protein LOC103705897 isoform X2 [Phoenix dactylifera]
MSLLPWLYPLRFTLLQHSHPTTKLSSLGSKKFTTYRSMREAPKFWCSSSREGPGEFCSKENLEGKEFKICRPWHVPWDWKVTACVMMPYLISTIFTGFMESGGSGGLLKPYSETMLSQMHSTDEIAMQLFMDQLLKSVAKLSVLYMFVRPHQPFPDDIFSFRWGRPFNLQNGWILWASGGLVIASFAVFLVKALISASSAGQTPNQAEFLVQLLPFIDSSNLSTFWLLGTLGILAPVCEETVYRGFLMTSLTKWFPLPVSVALSSALFTIAHHSPGKSIEIFIFGLLLGLVYAQTRNLLAPITMHACWNAGVIIILTYLHSQGHEIQKYVL